MRQLKIHGLLICKLHDFYFITTTHVYWNAHGPNSWQHLLAWICLSFFVNTRSQLGTQKYDYKHMWTSKWAHSMKCGFFPLIEVWRSNECRNFKGKFLIGILHLSYLQAHWVLIDFMTRFGKVEVLAIGPHNLRSVKASLSVQFWENFGVFWRTSMV